MDDGRGEAIEEPIPSRGGDGLRRALLASVASTLAVRGKVTQQIMKGGGELRKYRIGAGDDLPY